MGRGRGTAPTSLQGAACYPVGKGALPLAACFHCRDFWRKMVNSPFSPLAFFLWNSMATENTRKSEQKKN